MPNENFFRIIFIIFILFVPLIIGYRIRKSDKLPKADSVSASIIALLTKSVIPVITLFAFWRLDISHPSIFALPVIGLVVSSAALIPAGLFAKLHNLNHKQRGSFFTSAMFSNIGYTLGGFIAFVLYGEVGFGLTVLYGLYFRPFFHTVGFYIGENYSGEGKIKIKDNIKKMFTEGIRLFPLLGVAGGIVLNLLSIPRPDFARLLNDFLIPFSTFGFMLAVGMTLKFSAIKRFKAPLLSMSLIKFIWSPLVGIGLAYLLGYHAVMDGLPLKIALIESFMPVAIASLIIPSLFNLDQDLTNSCWLFTTFLIIPLLPLLLWILSIL
jgi:predicted permease